MSKTVQIRLTKDPESDEVFVSAVDVSTFLRKELDIIRDTPATMVPKEAVVQVYSNLAKQLDNMGLQQFKEDVPAPGASRPDDIGNSRRREWPPEGHDQGIGLN